MTSPIQFSRVPVLVLALSVCAESIAAAQPAPPAAPAAPAPVAPVAPPAAVAPPAHTAPAPVAATPAVAAPLPVAALPPPAVPSPAPAASPAEPPAPKWYDSIALDAFVDGYASVNYNFPKLAVPAAGFAANQLRALDTTNGFALNWAGVNASYAPAPVGGTVSLRVGPGARVYAGNDNLYGLKIIKQAYASWKPGGKDSSFQIDFGKYDEPFGSEVAESQGNMNYSRSALFNYAQPLFFTGLRLDWQATAALDLKLILANGWNNSVGMNVGKTVGLQVNFKPADPVLLSLGYAMGPQQADTVVGPMGVSTNVPDAAKHLRHLIDFVADVTVAEKLRFLLNADFVTENTGVSNPKWFGVNLGVRYAISAPFALALRGEWLSDPDGYATNFGPGATLIDGTLTFEAKPTQNLIVKLEQRLDSLSNDAGGSFFLKGLTESSKTQMTTMLGVVVKTN